MGLSLKFHKSGKTGLSLKNNYTALFTIFDKHPLPDYIKAFIKQKIKACAKWKFTGYPNDKSIKWFATKRILNYIEPIPLLRRSDNSKIMDDPEKANVFTEHLATVFMPNDIQTNPQHSSRVFINPGFNNWKKSYEKLKEHENSAHHRKSRLTWLDRVNTKHRIDKTLAEKMLNEKKYWVKVLHRVVSVVKFLAVRGLAFEGNDSRLGSPSNGNFLGILEVISEFDPFLKQHMNERANKGSGNVSYFSMRICNEIIDLMANEVLLEITKQLQETKYFGLILDSTLARAHRDQFAVVVRYCYKGLVFERFLTYIHILSHTGISMTKEVIHFLENNNINLQYCRGQSYDNANNMTERTNSKLQLIENARRTSLYQEKLNSLVRLSAEREITDTLDFSNLIQKFTELKSRKKPLT
ncbi:zinc finger MYM-type protein 1-like [Sipha flava]|uniref:Zinc finger MYM-type protein 1-like n=1 Tax=Sipha flava TaxID=143950 RepID=A0A8B8FNU4_9HEMI|nr:zinc finger MYM-type protein 1-like [Sipha flava]